MTQTDKAVRDDFRDALYAVADGLDCLAADVRRGGDRLLAGQRYDYAELARGWIGTVSATVAELPTYELTQAAERANEAQGPAV